RLAPSKYTATRNGGAAPSSDAVLSSVRSVKPPLRSLYNPAAPRAQLRRPDPPEQFRIAVDLQPLPDRLQTYQHPPSIPPLHHHTPPSGKRAFPHLHQLPLRQKRPHLQLHILLRQRDREPAHVLQVLGGDRHRLAIRPHH